MKIFLIQLSSFLLLLSYVSAFTRPKPSAFGGAKPCLPMSRPVESSEVKVWNTLLLSTTILLPNVAMATTEVELADLPPPWIPVVFGLGLVAVRN